MYLFILAGITTVLCIISKFAFRKIREMSAVMDSFTDRLADAADDRKNRITTVPRQLKQQPVWRMLRGKSPENDTVVLKEHTKIMSTWAMGIYDVHDRLWGVEPILIDADHGEASISIGTSGECDIRINPAKCKGAEYVGRNHVCIRFDDGHLIVEDNRSRNHLYSDNGELIETALIRDDLNVYLSGLIKLHFMRLEPHDYYKLFHEKDDKETGTEKQSPPPSTSAVTDSGRRVYVNKYERVVI